MKRLTILFCFIACSSMAQLRMGVGVGGYVRVYLFGSSSVSYSLSYSALTKTTETYTPILGSYGEIPISYQRNKHLVFSSLSAGYESGHSYVKSTEYLDPYHEVSTSIFNYNAVTLQFPFCYGFRVAYKEKKHAIFPYIGYSPILMIATQSSYTPNNTISTLEYRNPFFTNAILLGFRFRFNNFYLNIGYRLIFSYEHPVFSDAYHSVGLSLGGILKMKRKKKE